MTQARVFFERALTLDPDNIEALVGAARVESALGSNLFSNDRIAHLAAALHRGLRAAIHRHLRAFDRNNPHGSPLQEVQHHVRTAATGVEPAIPWL